MPFLSRLTAAGRSLTERHLAWVCRVATTRPGIVFTVSLLLVVLSAVSVCRIRFDSDIFSLLPSDRGALGLLADSLRWSGEANTAVFLLEGEKERLPAEAERFAQALRELTVEGKPAFTRVRCRMYDPEEAISFAAFVGYAASRPQAFLPPERVGELQERLRPEGMRRALGAARVSLAGPGGAELVAADPLGLRDLILPRLREGAQGLALDPSSAYFASRDGKLQVVLAEPARPVTDMEFARKLVTTIDALRRQMPVKVSCTGAHLSAVIDEREIRGNVVECILSSLVVVLGIFFLTYRRLLPTLLIPLILLVGTLLAVGTAGLFLPGLSIISFAFTALVIGLGTDYSIHLYDRYHCERQRGEAPPEALRLAILDTGRGLFTAAATTAVPFFAMTVSDIRGLFELGLLVGLGVVYSLYATYFFLPPLLLFEERLFPRRVYAPLPSFALGRLWSAVRRHRKGTAALSIVLIAGCILVAAGTSFEGDLKRLQPAHSEALRTQEQIERHLALSPRQMLVAVEGRDAAQVFAAGERVSVLAEAARQRGEIATWSSLSRVVNGRQVQERLLGEVTPAAQAAAISFDSLLLREGFDAAPFAGSRKAVASVFGAEAVPTEEAYRRLLESPLRGVAERHLVHDGRGWHFLLYLHYGDGRFSPQRFVDAARAEAPQVRATSVELVSDQLLASVKKSFGIAFFVGGSLVLLLLLTHFRSADGIFDSLFPLAGGVAAMLATMVLLGMRLNFMNTMVLVTIIGMGSDYGLHISYQVKGGQGGTFEGRYIRSSRAVILSALTTIAGFGSLAFSDYGALASIGWATNFGIAATALFSVVALPAFFRIRGNSPTEG